MLPTSATSGSSPAGPEGEPQTFQRDSLLAREIAAQPAIVAGLLAAETPHIASIVEQLPPFYYALIAARGSSDHAALYAKYVWATLAGYPVALAAPSLSTLYGAPLRLDGALVVGISQSGQSPDIVAVLAEGRRQGRPTLAITNDPDSPLAQTADHVVLLHAGAERSVAATKTYTASCAVIAAFAAQWRAAQGDGAPLAALQRLPDALTATLASAASIAARAERYRYMTDCVVVGRGYNYATSLELGLKLKELTYVLTTSYSSADFRHGPIATVGVGLPVLLIMPSSRTYDDMLDLAHTLRERGAELLVISDADEALALATTQLPLPTYPISDDSEWLTPITAILPGQLLALHLALAKGLNPDVPRGLQKVTRTL